MKAAGGGEAKGSQDGRSAREVGIHECCSTYGNPKLRFEIGYHTKFKSTSEQKYLYQKRIERMETNYRETNALLKCIHDTYLIRN